jgi:hypothetical protein
LIEGDALLFQLSGSFAPGWLKSAKPFSATFWAFQGSNYWRDLGGAAGSAPGAEK